MKMRRRLFMRNVVDAGAAPCIGCLNTRFPRDKVRLACVGIGQQAWCDIMQFEKTGLAEFAAFCDTDLQGKQCRPARKKFPKVPIFTDFRKMLDAMEGKIDAVAVMNRDHSHFPALMVV